MGRTRTVEPPPTKRSTRQSHAARTRSKSKAKARPNYRSRILAAVFSLSRINPKKEKNLTSITRFLTDLSTRRPETHSTPSKTLVKRAKEALVTDGVLTPTGHAGGVELDAHTKAQMRASKLHEGNDSSDDEKAAVIFLASISKLKTTSASSPITPTSRKRSKPPTELSSSDSEERDFFGPTSRPRTVTKKKPAKARKVAFADEAEETDTPQPDKALLRLTKTDLAKRLEEVESRAEEIQAKLDEAIGVNDTFQQLTDGFLELQKLCDSYKSRLDRYEEVSTKEEEEPEEEDEDEDEDEDENARSQQQARQQYENEDLGGMEQADFDDSGFYSRRDRSSSAVAPTEIDDGEFEHLLTTENLQQSREEILNKPQVPRTHSYISTRLPSPAPSTAPENDHAELEVAGSSSTPFVDNVSRLPTPGPSSSPDKDQRNSHPDDEVDEVETVVHDEAASLRIDALSTALRKQIEETDFIQEEFKKCEKSKDLLQDEIADMSRKYQDSQLDHKAAIDTLTSKLNTLVLRPSTSIETQVAVHPPRYTDTSTSTGASPTKVDVSTSTTPTRELQIQLLNCIVSSLKENLDIANQELAETRSLLQSEKALSTEATATLNATKLELDQSRLSLAITQDELITSQESLASTSKSLEETKELVMETQKISAEAQELARDFSAKLNASLTSNDELLRIAEVSQEEFRKVGEELRGVVEEKEKRVEELTMLVTEQNDKTDDLTRSLQDSSNRLSTEQSLTSDLKVRLQLSRVQDQLLSHFLNLERDQLVSQKATFDEFSAKLERIALAGESVDLVERVGDFVKSLEKDLEHKVKEVERLELEFNGVNGDVRELESRVVVQKEELAKWTGVKIDLAQKFGIEEGSDLEEFEIELLKEVQRREKRVGEVEDELRIKISELNNIKLISDRRRSRAQSWLEEGSQLLVEDFEVEV